MGVAYAMTISTVKRGVIVIREACNEIQSDRAESKLSGCSAPLSLPPFLSSDTGMIDGGRTEIKHATRRECRTTVLMQADPKS